MLCGFRVAEVGQRGGEDVGVVGDEAGDLEAGGGVAGDEEGSV